MKLTAEFKGFPSTCQVIIGEDCLLRAGKLIRQLNSSQVFILTNPTLQNLHYGKLKESLSQSGYNLNLPIVIPDGERFKNLKSLSFCYDRLVKHQADRKSVLVTLGGGVITDLGGMLAATYMRGIRLVHIPTTLLAQVDAAIGGKAGINHPGAKNMIGCFYQPNLILIDPLVLNTLSQRDYLNGVAEVIKIALVADTLLFKFLKQNIFAIIERKKSPLMKMIGSAVKSKINITTRDTCEKDLRKILNLGHTLAHALEAHQKYKNILHGEAVSLGMLVALQLSVDLKIGTLKMLDDVKALLEQAGLPTKIKRLDTQALWKIMYLDKKAGFGKINFVLLKKIGKPSIKAIEYHQFKQACRVLS
jgi:3-dehydroquinate synthase